MFVSRLIAALFVVVVGGIVFLATSLRDPADSAVRLPAELEVETVSLPSAPFDALAQAYAPFEAEQALAATIRLAQEQLGRLLPALKPELGQTGLDRVIEEAVQSHFTATKIAELHDLLSEERRTGQRATSSGGTSANPLVLSAEEQRVITFGDAVAAEIIAIFTGLQSAEGGLTRALEQAGLPALQSAVRLQIKRWPRVVYEEIAQEEYTPLVEVTGSTAVNRRTQVRVRTGSTVEEVLVDAGDMVESGDILVRLADDGRQAQLLQARASIAQAEANLLSAQANIDVSTAQISQAETRLSDARDAQSDIVALGDFKSETERRNAVSAVLQAEQDLAVARSGLTQAQAGLAQAQASLQGAQAAQVQIELDIGRLTVRAPFAGRIEERFVELGAAVNPGDPVVRLADVATMLVQAQVSDRLRRDLHLGDSALVSIGDGATAVQLEGPITLIGTTSDANTRTFVVEVELQNDITAGAPLIVDNQFAKVTFAKARAPVYRIPQSALTSASITGSSDVITGLLTLDEDDRVTFNEINFADYNEGGELLIHADRLGTGPIRLIVGRGGFVDIGDQVDARGWPNDENEG